MPETMHASRLLWGLLLIRFRSLRRLGRCRLALLGGFHVVLTGRLALVGYANPGAEFLVVRKAYGHLQMNGRPLFEVQHIVRVNVGWEPKTPVDVFAIAFKVRELLVADF